MKGMQAELSLCGFRFAAMPLAPRQRLLSAAAQGAGLHFHPKFQGVLAPLQVQRAQALAV
jgi:hypothetical protein